MAAKKKIDYDLIEADWRAGLKPGTQLAREYTNSTGVRVSHVAISKHFKRCGIERKPNREGKVYLPDVDCYDGSGFVYIIYLDDSAGERYYKIGMSVDFNTRKAIHQCGSPFDLGVACCYYTGNMRNEEKALHNLYVEQRIRGEWFNLDQDDLVSIAKRSLLI